MPRAALAGAGWWGYRLKLRNGILGLVGFLTALVAPVGASGLSGWAFHAGSFNATKNPKAAEVGFELRFPTRWPRLDAVAGAAGNEEGSFWAYAGARYSFHFDHRWAFTPGLAVSVYEAGEGKDLGGPIEFRSSYEISYRASRSLRLGLVFYHLSNAGLYDLNPGSNSLVLTWSLSSRPPPAPDPD